MKSLEISNELQHGILRYRQQFLALGGYGARVAMRTRDGVIHYGILSEAGTGACQPCVVCADGSRFGGVPLSEYMRHNV